jgi:hypothetical protein
MLKQQKYLAGSFRGKIRCKYGMAFAKYNGWLGAVFVLPAVAVWVVFSCSWVGLDLAAPWTARAHLHPESQPERVKKGDNRPMGCGLTLLQFDQVGLY